MQSNTVEIETIPLIFPVFLWKRGHTSLIRSRSKMVGLSEATGLSSRRTSRSSTSGFPITFTDGSASTLVGRYRRKITRIGRMNC